MDTRLVCLSQCVKDSPSRGDRIFVSRDDLPRELLRLRGVPGVEECVILSTCIRFEIYAVVRGGLPPARLLPERPAPRPRECGPPLTVIEGDDAVRHLFSVACGLDSKIIGEKQIAGQVRNAYGAALDGGCTGPLLNRLFQRALNVSRKVRTRTGIDRGACSAASLAARLLSDHLGGLRGRRAVILGAGQLGKLVGLQLSSKGCAEVCFSSRSAGSARAVAEQCSASWTPFSRFYEALEEADILVTATGAPHEVIGFRDVVEVMRRRNGRPLSVADLADPPDVDRRVSEIEGITHFTINRVDELADETKAGRAAAACEAWSMVEEAVADFTRPRTRRHPSPASA
jgi:glutamyl-tRNA reductase